MSLDYEDYLKIKRQSKILGIAWKIADACYYIGLLGGVIVPLTFISKALLMFLKHEPLKGGFVSFFTNAVVLFALFAVLFFASSTVKGVIRKKINKA